MKPCVLTVTLNPVIDKAVIVPDFKVGRDFREESMSVSAGGKGINVSQVLSHIGVKNIATGFLGVIGGSYIKDELAKQKIENAFIMIDGIVRTSLTIIDTKNSKLTRILERGPKVKLSDINKFKGKYSALLNRVSVVVLSGRSIPGAYNSLYAQLIRMAKQKKVLTVFDTSGEPFPRGLKEKPFMIKPNVDEAEELLGRRIRSKKEICVALKEFKERGIELAVITDGSRGAYLYDKDRLIQATPPKINRKNPVGCGDAFIAGFVGLYIKNRPLEECVSWAVACGAANASSIDPGEVSKQTVLECFKQVKINS
ncbi:MAG: 1-phosphofructokinase family hexose kinase [Candidatus Omnitrophica bacterium]|nr:1-phosphofructokinase family hexose kinase [Candidatus Omnitrophota bacterium]